MIEVKDVTKKYFIGTPNEISILKGLSLKVEDGEFLAIVGQSGSGKSTLMNILGALDLPTTGQYLIDNVPVENFSQDELSDIRNRKIGFVFQKFFLIPRTSALSNVSLPMEYSPDFDKKICRERAEHFLEMVGMKERMHHMPNELSGGQQQRVAIARALMNDPKIILADEPTGALDANTGVQVMDIFKRVNKEEKKTIILITHNDELAEMADRIITISDGNIVGERTGTSRNKNIISSGKKTETSQESKHDNIEIGGAVTV